MISFVPAAIIVLALDLELIPDASQARPSMLFAPLMLFAAGLQLLAVGLITASSFFHRTVIARARKRLIATKIPLELA